MSPDTAPTPLRTFTATLHGDVDAESLRRALVDTIMHSRGARQAWLILDMLDVERVAHDAAATLQDILAADRKRWAGVVFVGMGRTWTTLAHGLSARLGLPVHRAESRTGAQRIVGQARPNEGTPRPWWMAVERLFARQ